MEPLYLYAQGRKGKTTIIIWTPDQLSNLLEMPEKEMSDFDVE